MTTPAQHKRYNHSAKGIARHTRYNRSQKHRDAEARYVRTPHGALVKRIREDTWQYRLLNILKCQERRRGH